MKNAFTSIVFLLLGLVSAAQVMTGKVGYQRSQQPATIVELPYATGVVESAIRDQLTKKGLRADNSKGFMLFRNMQLIPSDTISSDIYFKVDRKGRKDDNTSVVYLMVARKNEDVAARNGENDYGMEQAKGLLNDLLPAINAAGLEAQIKAQQSSADKAERKFKDLVSEGRDLENRKRDIDKRISDNLRDQDSQKLEIERQRQALTDLMSKRRS